MTFGLSAVAILVPDYEAGLAFFVGVLGFGVIEDIDQGGGKRWLLVAPDRAAPTRLLLARAATDRQVAAVGDQSGGRVFLFLETDDFARDHARLSAAGIVFEEAPRRESYGTVAVFRDPFGNRWDLIQPASA